MPPLRGLAFISLVYSIIIPPFQGLMHFVLVFSALINCLEPAFAGRQAMIRMINGWTMILHLYN